MAPMTRSRRTYRSPRLEIPPRSNRKVQLPYDKKLYRERNRIERSFGRLKDFRRIATRFDRNVKSFMAALCLAAVVIWWS